MVGAETRVMIHRANEYLATHLAQAFATMACFWVFLILSLLPLFWRASMPVVQFISSGVLQLIALPLIAVAGKIIQDQQAQHAADIAALHDRHDAHAEMLTAIYTQKNGV